ncbi:MAG: hypothetical protein Kow0075_05260 [Salibacteraceae bacterium]
MKIHNEVNQNKIAHTHYDIHPLIKNRWSPRSFKEDAVPEDLVRTMLEAASWAASSMNEQPWRYLVAHRPSTAFEKMIECLLPGNVPWAKKSAVMIISLAKKHFDKNGKENRHAMHDVGSANTTMLLQGVELGVYGHMMGGFDMDKTIRSFDIDPEKFEVVCFIALGFLDSPNKLPEEYKKRELEPRERKPIDSFVEFL